MHSLGQIIERLETHRALDRVRMRGREMPPWPAPPDDLENPYARYPTVTIVCLVTLLSAVVVSSLIAAISLANRAAARPRGAAPGRLPAKAAPASAMQTDVK
jgi:hypothetical protein